MQVAFPSKTLTGAECNYAIIEREFLGVVFGVEHFKHFTFGNEVHMLLVISFSVFTKEVPSCM